jgi:hypothetical protein
MTFSNEVEYKSLTIHPIPQGWIQLKFLLNFLGKINTRGTKAPKAKRHILAVTFCYHPSLQSSELQLGVILSMAEF